MFNLDNLEGATQCFVNLHGNQYPVLIQGNGNTPCLCIGIGTLMQKTLSVNFKRIFTVYSIDLYWIEKSRLANPTALTMTQIIDDIFNVIHQLDLKKTLSYLIIK